jgi:hypothetical protein
MKENSIGQVDFEAKGMVIKVDAMLVAQPNKVHWSMDVKRAFPLWIFHPIFENLQSLHNGIQLLRLTFVRNV